MASAELPLMMTKLPSGTTFEDGLRLQLADLDVVERHVERLGILDQAVVRDDRDALRDRAGHRRLDGRAVLGEDHEHVGALGDEVLDVAGLRLGRRLGVVRDVRAAAGLDRRPSAPARPTWPSALLGSCSTRRRRRSRHRLHRLQRRCRPAPCCPPPSRWLGCRSSGGCGAVVPSAAVGAGGTSPPSSSSSPQAARTRAALRMSAADRRACMRVSSPVACGEPERIR